MINTVKIKGDGYLVNGTMSVPQAAGNRHYQAILKWIHQPDETWFELWRVYQNAVVDHDRWVASGRQGNGPIVPAKPLDITELPIINQPEPEFTQAELDQQAIDEANAVELTLLAELDKQSIRDIRAYIAAQPDAPQTLKDREELAVAARGRIQ